MKYNKWKWMLMGCLLLPTLSTSAQELKEEGTPVFTIGSMMEVRKGDLEATTHIKVEQGIDKMYGLGPLDSLKGQVLIIDGVIYEAKVAKDHIVVTEVSEVKAPFFILSEVPIWTHSQLQEEVKTSVGLEGYLLMAYHIYQKPFAFLIEGTLANATISVPNWHANNSTPKPLDWTSYTQSVTYQNIEGVVVGFYYPDGAGAVTEKGRTTIMGFISKDKKIMGRLDNFNLGDHKVMLRLPRI